MSSFPNQPADDLDELEQTPRGMLDSPGFGGQDDVPLTLQAPTPRDRGMLDWPGPKLAKHLWKLFRTLDRPMQERITRWTVNARRRRGDRYIGAIKDPDKQEWRVYAPPDIAKVPPSLGIAPRLCRRLTAQMFQDPPLPEAVPSRDDDEARDAAELAERILTAEGSEAGTNNLASARAAFDKIHTHGSGFRHHYVDPQGGGSTPTAILASLDATTEEDAVERTIQVVGPDGQPQSITQPQAEPYVIRYVRPDGSLTDNQAEADLTWLPKLCHEVLTGQTVRLWPPTATHVRDARMVLMVSFKSWGDVKREFPEVLQLPDDQQKKIVSWRPPRVKDYLPQHLHEKDLEGVERADGQPPDTAIVVLLIAYAVAGPDAEDGLYAVIGGGTIALSQEDWRYEDQEAGRVEALDIPLDQFKGWSEGTDDPYGFGYMDFLGAGDELLASIDASRITHFQRLGSRRTFLPLNSTLTTKQLQATTGTVLPVNPGGEPKYEDIPAFPSDTVQFRDKIQSEMVDESGLQPSAQGQSSPNIQSGFHAVQMIEQTLAGLSDVRQNTADALERGWRLDLQLIRARFSGAHLLQIVGADGALKVKHWVASDLSDTHDVRLLRGTFTMLAPSMKSSIALAMSQAGLLSKEALRRATEGNTGGMLALQDDPHLARVRRQIEVWNEGPTTDANGMPDPAQPAPFDYRPVDDQADVAPVRGTELGRAMASQKFARKPPFWQSLLVAEYQRAAAAAGGQPMPPPGAAPTEPAQMAGPQTPALASGAPAVTPAGGATPRAPVTAPSPIAGASSPTSSSPLPAAPSTLPT